ncbi:unnamed protein product, partial [Sphacelaria rigidula]
GEIRNYFVADEEARHTRLVLGFIIDGHKPLTVVEEPEFHKMLRGFTKRPNLIVPSRASVGDLLTEKAIVARTGLMKMIKGQQLIMTCDGWTSGNEIPMMAVTAHWIDDAWKMKSTCLGAFEVAGSHTGVRLADALKGVMAQYNIRQEDMTVVTTDTAANQKNAIVVQRKMAWLPCICHVMDLVTGVLMKRLSKVRLK